VDFRGNSPVFLNLNAKAGIDERVQDAEVDARE
jgi:hypothetical protein